MADPNKYKSVSIPRDTYETLEWLRKGNIINAELTFSKVIEYLAKSKIKEILHKSNEWNAEEDLTIN
mgnify:FL=1